MSLNLPDTSQDSEGEGADLVSEIELAKMLEQLDQQDSSRGRPLEIELVRHLTPQDLIDLLPDTSQDEIGEAFGSSLISRIRHSHHQIARLMAEGRKNVEISAMLGYSPSWISSLKNDPAFRELMAYYSSCRDEIMVEAVERQKGLGIAAIEELQDRLEADPDSFANRELMELVETNINKPAARQTGFGGRGNAAPPSINISFVSPEPKSLPEGANSALVIEALPAEGED